MIMNGNNWKRLAEMTISDGGWKEFRISFTRSDVQDNLEKLPGEDPGHEMKKGGVCLPILCSTVQKSLETVLQMGYKFGMESVDKLKMKIASINLETNFVHGSSLRLKPRRKKFGKISAENKKYWRTRRRLFSLFDEGIELDQESWFSVTPEPMARHIALRMRRSIIVDAFCGAGGNAIQFAMVCDKVIAIDIDPDKIRMARNNAMIYGVEHKIDFINMDFLKFVPDSQTKVNAVFLSPPWGGPAYRNKDTFGLQGISPNIDRIMEKAKSLSPNVALYLPRNTAVEELVKYSDGGNLEVEQNLLGGRFKTITVYYGNVINTSFDPILSSKRSTFQWNSAGIGKPSAGKPSVGQSLGIACIEKRIISNASVRDLRPNYAQPKIQVAAPAPKTQPKQKPVKKLSSDRSLDEKLASQPKQYKNFANSNFKTYNRRIQRLQGCRVIG